MFKILTSLFWIIESCSYLKIRAQPFTKQEESDIKNLQIRLEGKSADIRRLKDSPEEVIFKMVSPAIAVLIVGALIVGLSKFGGIKSAFASANEGEEIVPPVL